MSPRTGIRLGFTGTRGGMSIHQLDALRERLRPPATTWSMFAGFHHGDCVGADEQAHEMIMGLRVKLFAKHGFGPEVVVHPPQQARFRAFCQGDIILPPKPYLSRDRDIVDRVDMLIACPKTFQPMPRSGTWWTVGHAASRGTPVVIIMPDGRIQLRNWEDKKREVMQDEQGRS